MDCFPTHQIPALLFLFPVLFFQQPDQPVKIRKQAFPAAPFIFIPVFIIITILDATGTHKPAKPVYIFLFQPGIGKYIGQFLIKIRISIRKRDRKSRHTNFIRRTCKIRHRQLQSRFPVPSIPLTGYSAPLP